MHRLTTIAPTLLTLAVLAAPAPGAAGVPLATYIYWADVDGEIRRAQPDGQDEAVVARYGSVRSAAVDEVNNQIYFVYSEDTGSTTPREIRRSDLDGTNVEPVLEGLPTSIRGLAVDPTSATMFWTDHAADTISRAGLDGAGVSVILSGLDNPHDVVVGPGGSLLCWSEGIRDSSRQTTGAIRSAGLDGSSPTTLFSGLPGTVRDLAVAVHDRGIFADDLEYGSTDAWSAATP